MTSVVVGAGAVPAFADGAPVGGSPVTIHLSEARAVIDAGGANADSLSQAIINLAAVAARTEPMLDVSFDPETGELITQEGFTPALALGVRGVGIPVMGPFTKHIPEPFSPLDMTTVDATPLTGNITGSSASSSTSGGTGSISIITDPGTTTAPETPDVGGMVDVDTTEAQSGGTDGSCNPNGEGMIQHEPLSVNRQTQNYYIDYTLVPYEKPLAHTRPGGMPTYQIALCAFGNMKVINGHRLLREGMAVTAWDGNGDGSIKRRIGQAYDTGVEDGISSGEVNFSLDVGAASVGASIGTTAVGKNLGATGMPSPMKKRDAPSRWSMPNVVQAWWDHNSSPWVPWRNKGSRSPQATINEGLYEFTYDIDSFAYGFQPYAEYRCTARDGCPYHVAI